MKAESYKNKRKVSVISDQLAANEIAAVYGIRLIRADSTQTEIGFKDALTSLRHRDTEMISTSDFHNCKLVHAAASKVENGIRVMGIENFITDALYKPNDYFAYHVGRKLVNCIRERQCSKEKSGTLTWRHSYAPKNAPLSMRPRSSTTSRQIGTDPARTKTID